MKLNVKNCTFKDLEDSLIFPKFSEEFLKKHALKNKKYLNSLQKDIIAQVVRWQLAKKREGNASTKTRSDVSATTRKPWGQKETGKSRQGSLVGPHFRGGGVVFGPHPRSYEYKLNKKFRKLALGIILDQKIESNEVVILESFNFDIKKTKDFSNMLLQNQLDSVLFVGNMQDEQKKNFSNLFGIDTLPLIGLNVLSCIKHKKIIFDLDAAKNLLLKFSNGGVDV